MKRFLIVTLFSILSVPVFAGSKYICKELDSKDDVGRTLILTQVGHAKIEEGKHYNFQLELFQNYNSTPVLSEAVTVTTEDVQVFFKNAKNKRTKLSGTIYLDELDQTSLTIRGPRKLEYRFDCR